MSGKLCQELYERRTESEIVYDHDGLLWYLLRLVTCSHISEAASRGK
jgi:hypothetical protein